MWYKYVTSGVKEQYGANTYEIVKNIKSNVRDIAARFVHVMLKKNLKAIPVDQIISTFDSASKLVDRKKIALSYQNNKIILKTKEAQHEFEPSEEGFLKFAEKIDFINALLFPSSTEEHKFSEKKLNIPEGQITVIKANNVADAIQLGNGTSWCISQPKNTMYQSYRQLQASTFYFVFDTTVPEGDPLRRVVVDVNNKGVLLTDLNNATGHIAEFGSDYEAYFEYLENNGVDLSQFQNDPYSDKEKEEYELLSDTRYGLQEFEDLYHESSKLNIKDPYSKYIGFGHILQPEQFQWLIKNNAQALINQYIGTGNPVSYKDLNLLNAGQHKTYYRARDIAYEHYKKQNTYQDGLNVEDFFNRIPKKQLIDMYFIDKMADDPSINKSDLLSQISSYYYQTKLGKDQIIKIINSKQIPGNYQLFDQILSTRNPEIVDAAINNYPEMIEYIKNVLRDNDEGHGLGAEDFVIYLLDKLKEPSLFVNYCARRMAEVAPYVPFSDKILKKLLEMGYADKLMNRLLTYDINLSASISYLIDHGASLENAWARVKNNLCANSNSATYIYELIAQNNPSVTSDWKKEVDTNQNEKNKEELLKSMQDSWEDENQKTIQSFNFNKYLRKNGPKL